MNTDNFSLAGITLDYGPCAFMEEFKINKGFSSIEMNGRYSFVNQVPIAQWNILRLADCLLSVIDNDKNKAIGLVEKELSTVFPLFEEKRNKVWAKKMGLKSFEKEDQQLVRDFLQYLEDNSLDYTLSFYHLNDLYEGDSSFYAQNENLESFIHTWKDRNPEIKNLRHINPLYIPRNHLVQKAIDLSYQGDDTFFHRLNELFKNPFLPQEKAEEFSRPAKPEERVYQTFCGT
jgi:uncharacterized protein YdiU (UPF0061 family)